MMSVSGYLYVYKDGMIYRMARTTASGSGFFYRHDGTTYEVPLVAEDASSASPVRVRVDGVTYALQLGGITLIARIYLDYELIDPDVTLTAVIGLSYELVDPDESLTAVIGLDYTIT